ncbi:MAG: hypothetical protein AAGE84_31440 [Cyanobacteria bacterium P01_G01_bin.39]
MSWKRTRKYFKIWAICVFGIILIIGSILSSQKTIPNFVSYISGNIPLLILFWLYEYDLERKSKIEEIENKITSITQVIIEDINNIQKTLDKDRIKLDEKLENYFSVLSREIDNNEQHLIQLFNAFSDFVTEEDFDDHLRTIVTRYPTIQRDNFAIRKGVKKQIRIAKETLIQEEYSIDFNAILDYPAPFYQKCDGEINATNIGGISEGFYGRIEKYISELVKVNKEAIERNKNKNNKFKIQRLFIYEENDISNDLVQLIDDLIDIEVEVKIILRSDAEKTAQSYYTSKINKLEDFTIFIQQQEDLRFSGRLEAEDLEGIKKASKMRISTNKDTIRDLKQQFDALWASAEPCEKGSDLIAHVK